MSQSGRELFFDVLFWIFFGSFFQKFWVTFCCTRQKWLPVKLLHYVVELDRWQQFPYMEMPRENLLERKSKSPSTFWETVLFLSKSKRWLQIGQSNKAWISIITCSYYTQPVCFLTGTDKLDCYNIVLCPAWYFFLRKLTLKCQIINAYYQAFWLPLQRYIVKKLRSFPALTCFKINKS